MPTNISLDFSNRKMQMNEQNEVFEYYERHESKEREKEKYKKTEQALGNCRMFEFCLMFFFCLLYLQAIFYRKMFEMAPYTQHPPYRVPTYRRLHIQHLNAIPFLPWCSFPIPPPLSFLLIDILIDVRTAHTTSYETLIL